MVMHANMQGIQSKFHELECFLTDNVFDFDYVCISEHWLSNDELCDGLSLANFSVVTSFSRTSHVRGGVLICAKKEATCVKLDFINSLSNEVNCEVVALFCESSKIVIVCMYRSPSGDYNVFLSIITQVLNLLQSYKQVVIAGDFNVRFCTLEAPGGQTNRFVCILRLCKYNSHRYQRQ